MHLLLLILKKYKLTTLPPTPPAQVPVELQLPVPVLVIVAEDVFEIVKRHGSINICFVVSPLYVKWGEGN